MEVEPFLLWINAVEIFFMSKDITNDHDKLLIIGCLISETNLLSFFQAEAQKMTKRSWAEVKADLFDAALPSQWLSDLQRERMINFNSTSLTDFQLAEGMTFGLPQELQNEVKKLDILKPEGFKFKEFVRRVGNCYDAMPKKIPRSRFGGSNSTAQQGSTLSSLPREEYIWRIHSYLDLVGKCHHCKQHCGNAAGTCPGPVYRGPVDAPPSFIGGFSQPGRPTGKPAGVAAVANQGDDLLDPTAVIDDDTHFDEYHAAAVTTFDNIESSLHDDTDVGPPGLSFASVAATAMDSIIKEESQAFMEGEALMQDYPGFNPALLDELAAEFAKDDSADDGYVRPRSP
ncbi:hypothetical protein PTTG_10523 [Puccinia triticina 1-1 BBBD Race 1]|uniref:Uncharacterized protein n=1 Tax=Puccinia triticina (isolate 1-1 / race 1 (BBBD)) TaxID=630390 RepID=A0A180FYK2_PUCT1|nr:hypothetical protein PTTG_10523 [Puccinia triticina 1-1 BBBD Race 1]